MKVIAMKPVKSSQILSVGYDSAEETLYVEFTNWNVYAYFEVPDKISSLLLFELALVGSNFSKNIKGRFEYKKLEAKVNNNTLKI